MKQQFETPERASDFRVPPGKVGITIDIKGSELSTMVFDAKEVGDMTAYLNSWSSPPDFYQFVRQLAEGFAEAQRCGCDADRTSIAMGMMWTMLHHPVKGAWWRSKLSDALYHDGKAHITWYFDPKLGLGIALGPKIINLDGPMSSSDQSTVVEIGPDYDRGPKN